MRITSEQKDKLIEEINRSIVDINSYTDCGYYDNDTVILPKLLKEVLLKIVNVLEGE